MIATLHALEKVQLHNGEFPLIFNTKEKNININDKSKYCLFLRAK